MTNTFLSIHVRILIILPWDYSSKEKNVPTDQTF